MNPCSSKIEIYYSVHVYFLVECNREREKEKMAEEVDKEVARIHLLGIY